MTEYIFFAPIEIHCIDTLLYCRWVVDIAGAPNTLYAGEEFQLQFKFGRRYPFESPQVSC